MGNWKNQNNLVIVAEPSMLRPIAILYLIFTGSDFIAKLSEYLRVRFETEQELNMKMSDINKIIQKARIKYIILLNTDLMQAKIKIIVWQILF